MSYKPHNEISEIRKMLMKINKQSPSIYQYYSCLLNSKNFTYSDLFLKLEQNHIEEEKFKCKASLKKLTDC